MSFPDSHKNLRIVFMGTPEFAVASLDALFKAGCNIITVITAPDKAGGRGMELQQSAVKKYAVAHQLPVLQPEKLRNNAFIEELKNLKADLQICVAFRMLPEIVWNMPPLGTINLHGSLLPQYRGAAPINWAIINGEKETGVTTFKLKHEIDTGDILLQQSFPITEADTAGTVHDKMKEIGAQLLLQTVKGITDDTLKESPQLFSTDEILHHAPKIFTEACLLNFEKPVEEVYNQVRGLSPYPAAFTYLEGKKLKIYSASKEPAPAILDVAPGIFKTDGKSFLKFACKDGFLNIIELQLEGKKRMPVADFLRGYRFSTDQ